MFHGAPGAEERESYEDTLLDVMVAGGVTTLTARYLPDEPSQGELL